MSTKSVETLTDSTKTKTLSASNKKLVTISLINNNSVIRTSKTLSIALLTSNYITHSLSFFGSTNVYMNASVNLKLDNGNVFATLISHSEASDIFLGLNVSLH